MSARQPKNKKEAWSMLIDSIAWFCTHLPVPSVPILLWCMFGGFTFLILHASSDKISLKDAQPLSANIQLDNIHKALFVTDATNPPIIFEGKLWGYEDQDIIIKKVIGQHLCKVYYKPSHRVYDMEFTLNLAERLQKDMK